MFHDSEGFESGPSSETGETVLTFIKDRSSAIRPDLQLHAIWCVHAMIHGTLTRNVCEYGPIYRYCIPLPDIRGLSENEFQMLERFESTGQVVAVLRIRRQAYLVLHPTIIIFTQHDKKVDSLLTDLVPDDEFTDLDIKRLQPVRGEDSRALEQSRVE